MFLAFYLNLPDDYRAFRVCLCFSISSDYNARSFSFYQQIFFALAAVAAAAGIVLLSQHICEFYIMPWLTRFWGACSGLFFVYSIGHFPYKIVVKFSSSPR